MRAEGAPAVTPTARTPLARFLWRLDTAAGLAAMFALALLLRVLIAPHAGFYGDLRLFQMWATQLREVGPHKFYAQSQFADYPPGYLYVLWLIGRISATPGYLLLKLPAILADLGVAWVAGTLAVRIAPAELRERWPIRALVAAAVLFNPAAIALSAVWGQVDAVPAVFVLSSMLLLFTGRQSLRRETGALLLFAVAIAMKPQSGFVLPVILYALYRRYLHGRTRPELIDGTLSIAVAGVLSLGLWAVSGLAFGLGPVALVRFYRHSASVYPVTSANAFNLWGAVGFWRNDVTGDHVLTVAGVPALYAGTLAFVACVALVLWRLHRAIGRGAHVGRALTVAAAVVNLLAYTLLTRMHERYMFVALACLAPLIFARGLRLAYAGLSCLFVLNLWYPYAYFNSQWKVQDFHSQPLFNWVFGSFATDTWQKRLWSIAVTAIVFAIAWFGMRWVERSRQDSVLEPDQHLPAVDSVLRWVERSDQDSVLEPGAPAPAIESALPRVERSGQDSVLEPDPPAPAAASVARRLRLPPALRAGAEADVARPKFLRSRWGPLALVGLTCLFDLVVLRGETSAAPNLNDSSFHLQMVRWASGQIHRGRVPLDGWFPDFSLGSSFFHHYQSLAETLTAYAALATGSGDQTTYLWILYLLLALWPISVYLGARLLDWDRWTAAAAAAVSPLIVSAPGYGYEHASYIWRGYGVYSQLWAMWLLPIAWGLTWRAVARGSRYAAAAAALALTIACHFITGYLAILTVGVWVIVVGAGFFRRVGRAALVTGGSLLVAAWVLVPLVRDTKWTTQSAYYTGSIFNDSYGARKVLGWLVTGKLFDNGRFPVITVLVLVGALVCLARARAEMRARALVGAFTLSLLLFFGRPTLGPLLKLLPGFGDVQIHRFIMGVHLAGILLAGVGLAWLLRTASTWGARLAAGRLALGRYAVVATPVLLVVACVGVLAPAWTAQASYDRHGAVLIRAQQAADATDGLAIDRLVAIVKARHDGRVYAGLRANWGHDYTVGYVPVYAWLADRDVDAIGFTFRTIASLSTDVEAAFDETNLAQYEMLNVKYLLLPSSHQPPVPARLLATSGGNRLWEVQTTGYSQVVDRAAAVTANRTDLEQATRDFRSSSLASRGIYPGVAFAGAPAPAPTFAGAAPAAAPAGTVVAQSQTLQDGIAAATVEANRPAVVLLKASYDPRWTATVDGFPESAVMMAPSLVGVEVPVGRHVVQFRYAPYGDYPLLLAIGALALLGLAFFPRRIAARLGR